MPQWRAMGTSTYDGVRRGGPTEKQDSDPLVASSVHRTPVQNSQREGRSLQREVRSLQREGRCLQREVRGLKREGRNSGYYVIPTRRTPSYVRTTSNNEYKEFRDIPSQVMQQIPTSLHKGIKC